KNIMSGGVQILGETTRKQSLLEGKVFVLTGTLETLTRSQAKKIIEAAGGKVTGSVSRNTNYLVAGTSPGSKLQRANDLGVPIIDEKTLRRLTIDE
ncbi:MAG: BRCT domain-containing protein, partial [Desulfobacterales bacterium]